MRVDAVSGLLIDTLFIPSPNYNLRPHNCVIDLIVIHGISLPPGKFGGDDVIRLFTNQLDALAYPDLTDLRVSAHVWIRRDGQIIQFVPFHLRAWHAGASNFQGRENCNDFSIGIELEGTDTLPYAPVQYEQLRALIRALQHAYPAITDARITGHTDIAPGRKTDPGPAFCWDELRACTKKEVL